MKNIAPKLTGMIVVAAMFGLLSVGVSSVVIELEKGSVALVAKRSFFRKPIA